MATVTASFHTDTDKAKMRNEIRQQIVSKLADKEYRDIFVSEQIDTGLAFQIRGLREQRGWSQSELGKRTGMAQSRISVMEDANYSRFSLNTLKRLASALDVALVVRFAPFSRLVDDFARLSSSVLNMPSFDEDVFPSEAMSIQTPSALHAYDTQDTGCGMSFSFGFEVSGVDSTPIGETGPLGRIDVEVSPSVVAAGIGQHNLDISGITQAIQEKAA